MRRRNAAERSAKELADIAETLKAAKNEYRATEVRVRHQAALAWIAYAKGNCDKALTQVRDFLAGS